MPSETVSPSRYFAALNSLRGVASCGVLILHLAWWGFIPWLPGLAGAWLWVDFFFVLSGFVIAANYRDRLTEGMELWRFAALRFARIYPLYFLVIALSVLLMFGPTLYGWLFLGWTPRIDGSLLHAQLLPSLLFLNFDLLGFPGFTWSVTVEWWLYCGFAVLWKLSRRLAIAAAVAGFVFAPLGIGERTLANPGELTALFAIFRGIAGFSVGVLCYELRGVCGSVVRRLGGGPFEFVACVAIGLVMAFEMAGTGHQVYIAFGFAVLVFSNDCGPISRALASRPFDRLGAWSYSIYLLHLPVLDLSTRLARSLGVEQRPPDSTGTQALDFGGAVGLQAATATATIAAVFIVAAFCWRFIEEPPRIWSKGLLSPRHPRVKPAAAGMQAQDGGPKVAPAMALNRVRSCD